MAAASLNLFLLDGTAEGAIKCSTRGQDTIVYKIPREDLNKYMSLDDLKKAGIYFLIGKKDGKRAIYVGQGNTRKNGNGVLGRVLEHKKPTEEYWNVAFILVSNSDWITATELNYLENQFCNMANNDGGYFVVNAWDPSLGKVSDETRVTMEPFIDYAKLALKIQGYAPFDKNNLITHSAGKSEGVLLSLVQKSADDRVIDAKCVLKDGRFIMQKGSQIALSPTKSCKTSIRKKRTEYSNCIDKNGILKENIEFRSASGAAAFAIYGAANGNILWKTEDGKNINQLFNE